jgi:hypothetical protein
MPPVSPPAPFETNAAIAVIRDAQGRITGTVTMTPEFSQWLQALLRSLNSAS